MYNFAFGGVDICNSDEMRVRVWLDNAMTIKVSVV